MLRSGKGIIGHVIQTGEMVLAPDVRQDPRYVAGRATTRSEIAVPIVSEAGVIGCLNVESDREAAVRTAAGKPAGDALRSVIDATRAFSGREGYDDDFTLVVLRRAYSTTSRVNGHT
jgi:GAF domain-containing protein